MAEINNLITFKTDTGGLDEASQKFDLLADKEKVLVRQLQDLEKQKNIDLFNAKNATEAAAAQDRYGKSVKATRTELDNTRKSLADLSEAQKGVALAPVAEAATKSFRTLYKETVNQIKTMEVLGQTGTAEYAKLVKEAGRLNDIAGDVSRTIKNQGSDTKVFDTLSSGLNAVTGAYTALTGAQQLFGSADKDTQEQMVKLQSAMAISMGLSQTLNELQRESAIMKAVETLQTKALTAATRLQTSSTVGATVAQRALNLVAKANPYVLLASLLITVVGALLLFSNGNKKAAETQIALNEAVKEGLDALKEQDEIYKASAKVRTDALQHEIDLIAARGGSEAEQAAMRAKLLEQQKQDAATVAGRYAQEIKDIDKNAAAVMQLTEQVHNLNAVKGSGTSSVMFDIRGNGKLVKLDIDEAIKLAQSQLDAKKQAFQLGFDAKTGLTKASEDITVFQNQQAKIARDRANQSAIAEAEARLIVAKKETAEELAAQIAVIQEKRRVDLLNVELTAGDRKKINAQADKDIAQAQNTYRIAELSAEKNVIDAKLAASLSGSDAEFEAKKQLLAKQKEIDLSEYQITASKKLLVEENYQKAVFDLSRDYIFKKAENDLNTQLSVIKTRLTYVRQGTLQELNLREDEIRKQQQLDIASAQQSITNTDELAAKIEEIKAESDRQIADNHKQYIADMLSFDEQMYQFELDAQLSAYKLQHKNTTDFSKQEYETTKAFLNKQSTDLEAEYIGRSKNDKDYKLRRAAIDKSITDNTVSEAQRAADKAKEIQQSLVSGFEESISSISNTLFSVASDQAQQAIDDFQHYYTTDADAAAKNSNLKLVTEQQYNAKLLELKRKQAQQTKDEALFNAGIAEAEAILNIWTKWAANPVVASALTALTLATFAVQIHAIESKPLPKYAKGRKGGKAELAEVSEAGGELVYYPRRSTVTLTEGASVIPAWKTQQLIGDMRSFGIPQLPHISKKSIAESKQETIDYKRLASEIGLQIKGNLKIPQATQRPVSINVDQTGVTVRDGNATTHYLNKKYIGNA